MRRLLRNPVGLLGAVLVALMVLLAVVGPLIWQDAAGRINPRKSAREPRPRTCSAPTPSAGTCWPGPSSPPG